MDWCCASRPTAFRDVELGHGDHMLSHFEHYRDTDGADGRVTVTDVTEAWARHRGRGSAQRSRCSAACSGRIGDARFALSGTWISRRANSAAATCGCCAQASRVSSPMSCTAGPALPLPLWEALCRGRPRTLRPGCARHPARREGLPGELGDSTARRRLTISIWTAWSSSAIVCSAANCSIVRRFTSRRGRGSSESGARRRMPSSSQAPS